MMASYLLSRTIVPTMAKYLLKGHAPHEFSGSRSFFGHLQQTFERNFETIALGHIEAYWKSCVRRRSIFAVTFLLFCLASFRFDSVAGQDFFPSVDSGQMRCMYVRGPVRGLKRQPNSLI